MASIYDSPTGWYRELKPGEKRTFWACFGGWTLDAMDVQIFSFAIPAATFPACSGRCARFVARSRTGARKRRPRFRRCPCLQGPQASRKQFENAQAMLGKSASVGEVASALGLTRQTVYRIKDDAAAAEAALATWGI